MSRHHGSALVRSMSSLQDRDPKCIDVAFQVPALERPRLINALFWYLDVDKAPPLGFRLRDRTAVEKVCVRTAFWESTSYLAS